jgi:hypothetical protein
MAKYKRKGCGPRGLGASPLKVGGRNYVISNDAMGGSSYDTPEGYNPNDDVRLWSYDKVDILDPINKGKNYEDMSVTQKVGSFNVPTKTDKLFADDINKHISNATMIPYERGVYTKPKQSTKAPAKPKSNGSIAYGGTKTWSEGSKSAKESTGKSLNQLVAARKGFTKGSAEYNTVQNQINAALGSKKRHVTPAKKKGYGK